MKPIYDISKEELYQKYKVEKLSIIECAHHFNCSESPIQRLLKKYQIPYNTKSEMMKGKANPVYGKKGKKNPLFIQSKKRCTWCGKTIWRKKCYDKFKKSFCSFECEGKWLSKFQKGLKNPHFTSKKVKCDWCGQEIWRTSSRIKRNKHFFCSRKHCGLWKAEYLRGEKIYNWKGGYEPYYGPNWLAQRRKAWERDHYTCQVCGRTKKELGKNPDVHHKIPFREFGLKNYKKANRLNNLITLCASHHTKLTNLINSKHK